LRVLSPVDRVEEVEDLIKAGADEFYCGLFSKEWHKNYPVISINRRPAGKSEFKTFEELRDCIKIAHSHNIPVFLTINEHYYIQKQYPIILNYIEKAINAGIDGLIVADLGLVLTLKEMNLGLEIQISTGGTAFNSETVKFYHDLGASRVTLPRHLTIDEIKEITERVEKVELVAFILNSRCVNVDGFCTFQHGLSGKSFKPLYKNACMLPYDIFLSPIAQDYAETERIMEEGIVSKRQHIWETVHIDHHPCGVCTLYEFTEMGISAVKIVGRGNPTVRKITDLKFIRTAFNFLNSKKPLKEEFRKKVQNLYRTTYKCPCRAYMCYYPSVME